MKKRRERERRKENKSVMQHHSVTWLSVFQLVVFSCWACSCRGIISCMAPIAFPLGLMKLIPQWLLTWCLQLPRSTFLFCIFWRHGLWIFPIKMVESGIFSPSVLSRHDVLCLGWFWLADAFWCITWITKRNNTAGHYPEESQKLDQDLLRDKATWCQCSLSLIWGGLLSWGHNKKWCRGARGEGAEQGDKDCRLKIYLMIPRRLWFGCGKKSDNQCSCLCLTVTKHEFPQSD